MTVVLEVAVWGCCAGTAVRILLRSAAHTLQSIASPLHRASPHAPRRYDKSPEQLGAFLLHLAANDKVQLDNGLYRLRGAPKQLSEN